MRQTLAFLVATIASAAALACSSSTTSPPHGTASSSGTSGPTAAASDDTNVPAGVAEATIGPIDLPPGVEKTVCITKLLGNTQDLAITGYAAGLAPGSHHLIVYKSTATEESPTPTPCSPFVGLVAANVVPLMLINKRKLEWSFPSGVGVDVAANQMIRLEAHYINAGSTELMGSGAVSLQGSPKASAPPYIPADFLFYGTQNIHIPPGQKYSTGPIFQAGIAGTHLISIFTHQHSLGTGIRVWSSAHAGDMSNMIVNDPDWSNPSWNPVSPQIDFDGTTGLTYQCDWNNTTQWTITFGESALDEMCFIGGYYYPGSGFKVQFASNTSSISVTPGTGFSSADAGSD